MAILAFYLFYILCMWSQIIPVAYFSTFLLCKPAAVLVRFLSMLYIRWKFTIRMYNSEIIITFHNWRWGWGRRFQESILRRIKKKFCTKILTIKFYQNDWNVLDRGISPVWFILIQAMVGKIQNITNKLKSIHLNRGRIGLSNIVHIIMTKLYSFNWSFFLTLRCVKFYLFSLETY